MSDASTTTPPVRPAPAGAFARRKPFRSTAAAKMDPAAAARQGVAVNLALATFNDAARAMAFLNAHHADLDARPIDLAVASAAGLSRVEQMIASPALASPNIP